MAKDESFIPIRSRENEEWSWLLRVLFSIDLWNLKQCDLVLTAISGSLKFERVHLVRTAGEIRQKDREILSYYIPKSSLRPLFWIFALS